MAIPKVMGIETEYGITVKNQPDFNPILSSLLLINSYETYRSSRVRWDYEAERPLRDARGFEYMEEKEGTSKEESRLINLILSTGARFYVDHAHPEYSSPETTNPRDTVIRDRAGQRILNLSRQRAERAAHDAVLRDASGLHGRGQGRLREQRRALRVPDLAARRLSRDRGGAG